MQRVEKYLPDLIVAAVKGLTTFLVLSLGLFVCGSPNAHIITSDGRKPLAQAARDVGLRPGEVRQALAANGMVLCPGSHDKVSVEGPASIIEKNDLVLASAHLMATEDGRRRSPLTACYFINYLEPDVRHYIDEKHVFVGTPGKLYSDFAVMRLSTPVVNVVPYGSGAPDNFVSVGLRIFVISPNYKARGLGREPFLQQCSVRKAGLPNKFGDNGYFTDCSSEPGDSGSPNLVFAGGRPVVVGIHQGESLGSARRCVYNDDDCSAHSTAIVGTTLRTILDLRDQTKR